MKVVLAKHAGFCMGVRRAVDTTLETIRTGDDKIATFGPLIHNPQVLELLGDRGVKVLHDVPAHENGTIIIRAHGIPPDKKASLKASGAKVKDATCPRVLKVQAIIRKYRTKGYATVIIGDRNHAEVEGLRGYAEPECQVIGKEEEIENLNLTGPYIVVSQTTQDEIAFEQFSTKILQRFPQGQIFNTICDSTHKRQAELRELCKEVDAMVVVGGRTSANTKRLGEIVQGMGRPVFMVENEEDLDLMALSKYNSVGVTAGASTPSWMINWVVKALESLPGRHEGVLSIFFTKLLWLLLVTSLYVGVAGGLMAFAFGAMFTGVPFADHFLIAFGYLFAMHNINRFSDQRSRKINDPLRALFYRQYRLPLLVASVLALIVAHVLAFTMGRQPFWLLAGMSFLGILYNVRFIPKSISSLTRVRGLKEIPGSKTFFVALAWAFVAVLIPVSGSDITLTIELATVFLFVFSIAFVRSALFDVFDTVGDRIVGRETLPVCIGERKTLLLLDILLVGVLSVLLIFPLTGWISSVGFWLIPSVIYLFMLARFYKKGILSQGAKLEFSLETVFVIVAILALLSMN